MLQSILKDVPFILMMHAHAHNVTTMQPYPHIASFLFQVACSFIQMPTYC
jgi:hypothetical protein